MTGEPMHTASKEKLVPELMFLSERTPQLSISDSQVKWPFNMYHFQLCLAHYKQQLGHTENTFGCNQGQKNHDHLKIVLCVREQYMSVCDTLTVHAIMCQFLQVSK